MVYDLRNRKSVAARACLLYEVDKSKGWEQEGFRSLAEWSQVRLGYQRRPTFVHLLIGKHLLEPCLISDEDVNSFGMTTARLLARLAKQGKLDVQWLEKAKKENTKQRFKELVERMVGRRSGKRDVGELLRPSFRGLVYAPITEQGIVYVFGIVAYELGFRVEVVQQRYPDCIARQKVPGKKERWREVKSNLSTKVVILTTCPTRRISSCAWEDDLKCQGRSATVPVLDLKSAIDGLPREVDG